MRYRMFVQIISDEACCMFFLLSAVTLFGISLSSRQIHTKDLGKKSELLLVCIRVMWGIISLSFFLSYSTEWKKNVFIFFFRYQILFFRSVFGFVFQFVWGLGWIEIWLISCIGWKPIFEWLLPLGKCYWQFNP